MIKLLLSFKRLFWSYQGLAFEHDIFEHDIFEQIYSEVLLFDLILLGAKYVSGIILQTCGCITFLVKCFYLIYSFPSSLK